MGMVPKGWAWSGVSARGLQGPDQCEQVEKGHEPWREAMDHRDRPLSDLGIKEGRGSPGSRFKK